MRLQKELSLGELSSPRRRSQMKDFHAVRCHYLDDAATSLFVLRSVERSREGEKEEYSVNHYLGVCREGEGSLL